MSAFSDAAAKTGQSRRASVAQSHADSQTEDDVAHPHSAAQPWTTQDQWAQLRPIITRLYKEENRTLKETMEIMEREHEFSATARMYKTRIKNWGLDKKFKAKEVLAMLQAQKERESENKETEFIVRGRKVDQRRMKRYLQRNKVVLHKFKDGELPDHAKGGAAKPLSISPPERGPSQMLLGSRDQPQPQPLPVPQPSSARQRDLQVHAATIHVRTPSPEPAGRDWHHSRAVSTVPRPLTSLADPGRDTERLLHGIRTYIRGSFSTGTWFYDAFGRIQSRKGGMSDSLLLDTWTRLEVVASSMATEQDVKVFGTLNPAFETIQSIVREEAPLLVSRMLRLSRKLELLKNRQLWRVLVDYIGEQTCRILGANHVMNLIWHQFRDMDLGTDEEVLDRAFMLIVAEFDRCCPSATNFGVLEAYRDHFDTVSSPSRRRNLEAQEQSLHQTLALMPAHSHGTPPMLGLLLRMRITSSLVACERSEFGRAEAILADSTFGDYASLGQWAIASQHGALGHILSARKEWGRAERAYLAAVAHVDGATGYQNESCCERMMANLERLYTITGRMGAANTMRDRRLGRLFSQSLRELPLRPGSGMSGGAAAAGYAAAEQTQTQTQMQIQIQMQMQPQQQPMAPSRVVRLETNIR